MIEFYTGSIDNLNIDHIDGIIDSQTDSFCLYGTYKTVELFLQNGITVYHYILTYEGHFSFSQYNGVEPMGVAHADDLFYLWNFNNTEIYGTDITVQNIMTTAWTNFATYGDPTPPGMSDLSWIPLQIVSDFKYWNISGENPTMDQSGYLQNRMKIWKETIG